MHFDPRVIDDLREMRALFRGGPLPRHRAGKREAMHQDAVLVHPLNALFEIVVERIIVRDRLPEISQRFVVRLGRPVRVAINRNGLADSALAGFRVPPVHAFFFCLRPSAGGKRGEHRAAGADLHEIAPSEGPDLFPVRPNFSSSILLRI